MPFEIGNQLGKRQRVFADAIRKRIVQNPDDLPKVIEAMFMAAQSGDVQAATWIRDSIDGKPQQQVSVDHTHRDIKELTINELVTIIQGQEQEKLEGVGEGGVGAIEGVVGTAGVDVVEANLQISPINSDNLQSNESS